MLLDIMCCRRPCVVVGPVLLEAMCCRRPCVVGRYVL